MWARENGNVQDNAAYHLPRLRRPSCRLHGGGVAVDLSGRGAVMADDLIRELIAQLEEQNRRLEALRLERAVAEAARKARDDRKARQDAIAGVIMFGGIIICLIGIWFA